LVQGEGSGMMNWLTGILIYLLVVDLVMIVMSSIPDDDD
jgi:hypothetical protein